MRPLQKCLIVAFFLAPLVAVAGEQQLDISTVLMRSTFKIQGEGSLGTVFIMGEPSPDKPDKLYYVLMTAAHVLEEMKSDVATLHLRKQEGDKFIRLPYPVQIRKEGIPLWTRHPDVDVAAMRIRFPRDADISTGMGRSCRTCISHLLPELANTKIVLPFFNQPLKSP